jgi:hypothetical protein
MNWLKKQDKSDLIFYALLLAFTIISLFVFSDYGISFDGPRQKTYGEECLDYYLSRGENKTALSYINVYYYGGLFDMTAAALCRISPLGDYETRHLLNALAGILGVLGTWKLARLLAGPRAALITAALLMLTPSYFGHMFMNPKDIPFAAGYVWSLYCILLAFKHLPRLPVSLIIRFGLALGLTLAIRIGGALLVAYACMGAGLYVILPSLFTTETAATVWWKATLRRVLFLAISFASAFAVAYVVMLLFWPWAQQDPLQNPLKSLEFMSKFGDWPGTILLGGKYVDAMDLPASYLPHYFIVKLPETILITLMLGLPVAALRLIQHKGLGSRRQVTQFGFLVFAIIFPATYAILKHSVLYDGLRHFLFVIPLICVLCGLFTNALLDALLNRRGRMAATAILVLMLAAQGIAMIKLHPNQYVYYNILTGWLPGAEGRYEMDYWANSYKETVETIMDIARARDGDNFEKRSYNIYVDGPYLSATYYFPDNFTRVDDPSTADYLFSHTRWDIHKNLPGRQIASISRMGVDLTVIHEPAPSAP